MIWRVLEIKETSGLKEIKHAYANKLRELKKNNASIEEVQKLKEAFDLAVRVKKNKELMPTEIEEDISEIDLKVLPEVSGKSFSDKLSEVYTSSEHFFKVEEWQEVWEDIDLWTIEEFMFNQLEVIEMLMNARTTISKKVILEIFQVFDLYSISKEETRYNYLYSQFVDERDKILAVPDFNYEELGRVEVDRRSMLAQMKLQAYEYLNENEDSIKEYPELSMFYEESQDIVNLAILQKITDNIYNKIHNKTRIKNLLIDTEIEFELLKSFNEYNRTTCILLLLEKAIFEKTIKPDELLVVKNKNETYIPCSLEKLFLGSIYFVAKEYNLAYSIYVSVLEGSRRDKAMRKFVDVDYQIMLKKIRRVAKHDTALKEKLKKYDGKTRLQKAKDSPKEQQRSLSARRMVTDIRRLSPKLLERYKGSKSRDGVPRERFVTKARFLSFRLLLLVPLVFARDIYVMITYFGSIVGLTTMGVLLGIAAMIIFWPYANVILVQHNDIEVARMFIYKRYFLFSDIVRCKEKLNGWEIYVEYRSEKAFFINATFANAELFMKHIDDMDIPIE